MRKVLKTIVIVICIDYNQAKDQWPSPPFISVLTHILHIKFHTHTEDIFHSPTSWTLETRVNSRVQTFKCLWRIVTYPRCYVWVCIVVLIPAFDSTEKDTDPPLPLEKVAIDATGNAWAIYTWRVCNTLWLIVTRLLNRLLFQNQTIS